MGSLRELPALAAYGAGGAGREREHALACIAAVARRSPPAGSRKLADLRPEELRSRAAGKEAAPAVAAISELDRRGLSVQEGFLSGLKSAPGEARMLAAAVLARRKWAPAVAELAACALESRAERAAALAACRAATEVGGNRAVEKHLRERPAGAKTLPAGELKDRRRKAVKSLLALLRDPAVDPLLAAAAADAVPVVLPAGEITLKTGVLEVLVAALGAERLRPARAQIGAALRELTGEDYPDEAKYWRNWWNRETARESERRGREG